MNKRSNLSVQKYDRCLYLQKFKMKNIILKLLGDFAHPNAMSFIHVRTNNNEVQYTDILYTTYLIQCI